MKRSCLFPFLLAALVALAPFTACNSEIPGESGVTTRWHDPETKTKKMEEGPIKDFKKHGLWKSWHENGQLRSEGLYKNGEKDGPWKIYTSDGKLNTMHSHTYKNGEEIK